MPANSGQQSEVVLTPTRVGQRSTVRLASWLLIVLLGPLAAVAVQADSLRIKPGLWQMRTEVLTPGATEPLLREAAECVLPENAKRSFSEMIGDLQGADKTQECMITQLDEKDGHATAKMHCELPSLGVTSDASFEIDYTDTQFELSGDMTATIAGLPITTRFANKGTWVGSACP